ncbi:YbaN family protein [Xenophilus arseniciresistens]|uniref:YbaN family protein n=1 Tax=Xenophilus arseniciresistens TaxID=1283306 RepID=A0AAE3NEI5_9BURK|nr:YbaN family protein [Xenophilus arseniciresistens]MDA7418154.1 YbaN family protein [Xenophilus arseniciresistens]
MSQPPAPAPAEPPPPRPTVARGLQRVLLQVLAVLALVLAGLGVVLPGLPTTPFVLLAAWAAARSSPRLAAWLERHQLFGPMIRDWQAGGRVSRRAKWSATLAMLACAAIMWWLSPRWGAWLGSATMALVGVWLWLRPEPGR